MELIQLVQEVVQGAWLVFGQMAPWLLLGFLVAGMLSVLIRPATVERHLGGTGWLPTVKAALFGVPLPLCSCGVIPVSASLRRHGASRAASISFLISTPQTGVDSIAVTYSLLGPLLAVFRPVAAFVTGVIGGGAVEWLDTDTDAETRDPGAPGRLGTAAPESPRHGDACAADSPAAPACADDCCAPADAQPGVGGKTLAALRYGFYTLPRDLAGSLLVGILLAGVIGALAPPQFFAETLGCGILAMLAMLAVGIPLYVCATASVPVAAAMMMKGICPGAALVFLIVGPATNAATISTIWKVMGRRTVVVYLVTVALAALASGVAFEALLDAAPGGETELVAHLHDAEGVGLLGQVSAVVLLALLAWAGLGPRLLRSGGSHDGTRAEGPDGSGGQGAGGVQDSDTEVAELQVEGMTCSHCAGAVQRALTECPGVTSAEVNLEDKRAWVRGKGLSLESMVRAVESLGYSARARERDDGSGSERGRVDRSEGDPGAGDGAGRGDAGGVRGG